MEPIALDAVPISAQVCGKPERDTIIVNHRAEGATIATTAAIAGCSHATVERVTRRHEELVAAKRRRAARTFLRESEAVVTALVATAKDSTNRLQVSAFKELSEKLCGWGIKNGDTHIHGDVNVGSIDARSINLDSSDADALAAKRAALGL